MKLNLLYKEESYKVMGAVFEVYKEMGCGFVEPVYQECLKLELNARKVPHRSQQLNSGQLQNGRLEFVVQG